MMSDLLSSLWPSKKKMTCEVQCFLETFWLYFISLVFRCDTKCKRCFFSLTLVQIQSEWRAGQWLGQSERKRQRDRRREGTEGESCCDSLFTSYERRFLSFFFSPRPRTLCILWDFKASISSRAERFGPGYCVNLEYSSGNFFALRAKTLLGSFGDSHDMLPPHLIVVNVACGGV